MLWPASDVEGSWERWRRVRPDRDNECDASGAEERKTFRDRGDDAAAEECSGAAVADGWTAAMRRRAEEADVEAVEPDERETWRVGWAFSWRPSCSGYATKP